MRSTDTAPRLVAARSAIHEAPAAAELTTEERCLRLFFAVFSEFAKFASTGWINVWASTSFLVIG
jgi:hypothetical protein